MKWKYCAFLCKVHKLENMKDANFYEEVNLYVRHYSLFLGKNACTMYILCTICMWVKWISRQSQIPSENSCLCVMMWKLIILWFLGLPWF